MTRKEISKDRIIFRSSQKGVPGKVTIELKTPSNAQKGKIDTTKKNKLHQA